MEWLKKLFNFADMTREYVRIKNLLQTPPLSFVARCDPQIRANLIIAILVKRHIIAQM